MCIRDRANERQKQVLSDKVLKLLGDSSKAQPLDGRTIACWGLSFKPRTDDMREAPALTVIGNLLAMGAKVRAHDPEALQEAVKHFGTRVDLCTHQYEMLCGCDALIVVTDWNEYRNPDFDRIKAALKQPIVVDGRNLYKLSRMREAGFTYVPLGRSSRDRIEGVS